MQTYQIDLDLLLESEETYQKSGEELEEKIKDSQNVLKSMDEDIYAGEDADQFRLLFSKHFEVYLTKTAEMTHKVVQKLFFAHNTGKYCKKKCYDFIGAFGGGEGTRGTESFGGKLYCDQDMIVMIKGEANVAVAYGENIHNLATKAERLLENLRMVPFNTGIYVSRINACCMKISQLEDYSLRLTEYAELVETMDDNLQKGLRECMPVYYDATANGADDRQAYLHIEYNQAELERLLKIPEDELTDADRAKRDVLLMKALYAGDVEVINSLILKGIIREEDVNDAYPICKMVKIAEGERGVIEKGENHVKYNEWFWGYDLSAPWCAAFVLWCANESGLMDGETLPHVEDSKGMALVTNVRDWYSGESRYHSINEKKDYDIEYTPCEGDFFISRSWDSKNSKWQYHIGIVAGYDEKERKIYTIEGNLNDSVQHGIRNVTNDSSKGVQGFCSNGGSEATLPDNWKEWKDMRDTENAGTR